MNIIKMEDPCGNMSNYIWNPGKMPICRTGKYSVRAYVKTCLIFISLAIL